MEEVRRSWLSREREVARLSREAVAETAKPTPNRESIGRLHAVIEEQCRGAREYEKLARDRNLALLSDLERNRLQALDEARKPGPFVLSARFLLLLRPDPDNGFDNMECGDSMTLYGWTKSAAAEDGRSLTDCFEETLTRGLAQRGLEANRAMPWEAGFGSLRHLHEEISLLPQGNTQRRISVGKSR